MQLLRFNKSSSMRSVRLIIALALATIVAAGPQSVRGAEPIDASLPIKLIQAALAQTRTRVTYDGSYRRIAYPGGDVPAHIGVCTDVIIRAYRAVGVDLQVRVHEDMRAAFASYPKLWGLNRPDSNIDHRRVPNLQTYFQRRGAQLPISRNAEDYLPGDLVTWTLPGNLPHIGLVSDRRTPDGKRWLIIHNIGRGPEVEDMMFNFDISGHYRYRGR